MQEKEYNPMYRPIKRFNEGVHLDTGEIDPDTGDRIIHNPNQYHEEVYDVRTVATKEPVSSVCKFCGQDPCSVTCVYR